MISLYRATDGQNWIESGNWLSDRPIGEWYGVDTDRDGRVTGLSLNSNKLSGRIPSEIGDLVELRRLDIRDNELTGEVPFELGHLQNLRELVLDHNRLGGGIPFSLGDLENLKFLSLHGNMLGGPIPVELGKLSSLEWLYLFNNRLSGGIPSSLGDLEDLRVLLLQGNMLDGPIPVELGNLSTLEWLYLSDNRLSGEIPLELGELSELDTLTLQNNQLSGKVPQELVGLSKLNTLFIGDNALRGCIPGALLNIPRNDLHRLDLFLCTDKDALISLYRSTDGVNWTDNTNWLSDAPIGEWQGVTTDEDGRVIMLHLERNALTGELPGELGDLASLQTLSLFGNRISGYIPTTLESLTNLKRMFLGGNQLGGCIPVGLRDVGNSDLAAMGLSSCDSAESGTTEFSIVAFSTSPNEMNLTWSYDLKEEAVQEIYRDGQLVASLPSSRNWYSEYGLDPNIRYEYKLVLQPVEGLTVSAEADAATMAYPPTVVSPMNINESGFTLAIVDESNPPDTMYRVVLSSNGAIVSSSDWDTSRCRTFDGLDGRNKYQFELTTRNMDGIETYPAVDKAHYEYAGENPFVHTQSMTGTDDPWARLRINGAVEVFRLTDKAREWMLADIHVKGFRNEPGWAGFPGYVGIGYPTGPPTLMHELMHGFWEHWNGFPETCDVMNIYTFKRDVAQFLLDFRNYDRLKQSNPYEAWRPFYNFQVWYADVNGDGRDWWALLERREFEELRDPIYHIADASLLSLVAGRLSLIPPTLQPYFLGFLADTEKTTWRDELSWYSRLPQLERSLWNSEGAFGYWGYDRILQSSPEYGAPDTAPRTHIPEELRQAIRNAERQRLVDFVNTLEDISDTEKGEALWHADFVFWVSYVSQFLYSFQFFLDELSPNIGIELDQANLDGVREGLSILVSDFYCGDANASELRESIDAVTAISHLQRQALFQMIEIRERNPEAWNPNCAPQGTGW